MSDPKPPEQQESWLRRQIKQARQQTRGDIYASEVGAGAQVDQLAVGKNIFQAKVHIGALVVPVRFIAVLAVLVALGGLAAWYVFTPATMPDGTFNIAVAEFGAMGPDGQLTASAQGHALSTWLYNKLNTETNALPSDVKLTIWNDSMNWLQKRVPVGMVRDEVQAKQVAENLNARMVIYGNLELHQDPASFVPQFYVRQTKGEADELTGSQQLGKPLPVPTPLNDEYLDLYLRPRGQALVWFARGISFDLLGRYDVAYRVFHEAEQQLDDWARDQGKEVLYYFIGREALFLAQSDEKARPTFASAEEALAAAEQAFITAKDIQPNYGRAYFGLGQVHTSRANRLLRARPGESEALEQARAELQKALEWYKQALSLVPPTPASRVLEKTRAAMGASYVLLAQTFRLAFDRTRAADDLASAVSLAQLAESDLESLSRELDQEDARLRAQTFLTLGNARYIHASAVEAGGDRAASQPLYLAALSEFEQCVAIASAQTFDEFLQKEVLPYCTRQRTAIMNLP